MFRDEESERTHATSRVLWIILALNIAVALAKASYAAWSNSLAVGSDAIHSFADGMSNIVGIIALRIARRPPDARQPYGYRKVEILASTGIGVLVAVAAVEFGWSAIATLIRGVSPPAVRGPGIAMLVATLAVNVFVARYEAQRGRALRSPLLEADAAHTASDVLVTGIVLLSQVTALAGLRYADPIAALVVVVLVARIAWRILGANAGWLIDRAIVDSARVTEIALRAPEVDGCHRVRSRGVPGAIHLDLHLTMNGALALEEAHRVAHRVECELRAALPEVIDLTIHIEPTGDPEDML